MVRAQHAFTDETFSSVVRIHIQNRPRNVPGPVLLLPYRRCIRLARASASYESLLYDSPIKKIKERPSPEGKGRLAMVSNNLGGLRKLAAAGYASDY